MFKFEDLKVNSCDDRQTDRMTTKVLSSHPRIKCGETNNSVMTPYGWGLMEHTIIISGIWYDLPSKHLSGVGFCC